MNETFFLVIDNSIVDRCYCQSLLEAQEIFNQRGWVDGDVLSEADWMSELQLKSFESISTES